MIKSAGRKTLYFRGIFIGMFMLVALLLSSCGFPGLISTSEQLPVVSQVQKPPTLPPVRFPRDEGAHRDLTEWWYYTGHLDARESSGKARTYGFELVVFQALRSDFLPVYASHFAVSDITRNEFHYDQRRVIEQEAVIPDSASAKGIDVHVGDWAIQGLNGQDHLTARMEDYAISLNLTGLKPATLHNGNGLITYGLAGFSYYYSRTRMAVSGMITDHNQSLQVTGQAWMDHQWGDFLTLAGGWDWYSIQLDDDIEVMLYFIRDAAGKTISTYAGYVDANANDYLLAPSVLRSKVLGKWTSPKTGITYPSGWQVDINDPRLSMSLTIIPQLRNQELVVYDSTGNTYWEGAVSIEGQNGGKSIAGEGYVELTGYAR